MIPRLRAVGILLNNEDQVLLMLRRKAGRAYATLPGGGIESGETPAEACARELLEEVNLVVTVGEEVLVLDNLDNHEHYFRVSHVSGEMRLGDGPEGIRNSAENSYTPQWVNVSELDAVNFVPEQVRALIKSAG
ncbi:NUDIX hydrolase [Deinococcus frigens]|uniref:NUDIX hydrolase n=1 Tax=Deinococcus frigens TaxID=249403 RepID=UPI000497312C|nr:NUDIX domain-containing protein [Deinococcus frigens]